MILIDLGNTNAKIFRGEQTIKIRTEEVYSYLEQFKNEKVVISSVVPRLTKKLQSHYSNIRFVEPATYNLMFANEGQLNTKGADRIIAAFGAQNLYGSKVVVCDIGTCVTLDVVEDKRYLKGFIYPGFVMLENLLSEKIEQLPKPSSGVECISTENQIFWANIYGFIGALKEMVEKSMITKDYQLVITGGSILKLKEEYGVDVMEELGKFSPVYEQQLIKVGLENYLALLEA